MSQNLIYTKIEGEGQPLVFMHGFLADHTVWDSIYPEFVKVGYKCILIDLPCHGKTRFTGEICTIKQMADEVFQFLANQKIVQPFVFGHSMGGYVGFELLRLMPIKLTLVHSNFWADPPDKKNDRNRVIDIIKRGKLIFLNEAIPHLFAPENRPKNQHQINSLIQCANDLPTTEIIAATAGMRDRNDANDLMESNKINIIHGTNDPVIPTVLLREKCAQLLNQTSIYEIPNCGHMSFYEQPQILINTIKSIIIE